ncbi:MAG: hypothetical protein ABIK83_03485 [Candidatus Zixiibacteriota bacterium]
MIRKSALFIVLVLFAFSLPAMACDMGKSGVKTTTANAGKVACSATTIADNAACDGVKAGKVSGADAIVRQANFDGKLVCMGCDLKKADGAGAACSAYGHKYAVKTADGRYINFLENKQSEDLVSGEKYHNQDVKVQGVFYANANQLEVKTFEVDGKTMSWCDHCKGMDACMYGKADTQ